MVIIKRWPSKSVIIIIWCRLCWHHKYCQWCWCLVGAFKMGSQQKWNYVHGCPSDLVWLKRCLLLSAAFCTLIFSIRDIWIMNSSSPPTESPTRLLSEESVHGLRTTFQYFAESFDDDKAAFEMRHVFLNFFFGTHFRIFVCKFLVHLCMVYASLQKLARPCSSPPPLDRVLHEVALHESIRYAPGDHVEQWLNSATLPRRRGTAHLGCPLLKNCDLYPSYWVFILGVLGHLGNIVRIWRHFRWSAFVTMDV